MPYKTSALVGRLQTLEAFALSVRDELQRIRNAEPLCDTADDVLKVAGKHAYEMVRGINEAYHWQITHEREQVKKES